MKIAKSKNNFSLFLLLLAVFISFFLRVGAVWDNNFAFTMDQGRDLVDIRQMVVTLRPRLVGPTTSINGVLLGPAWYYFLLPAFVLGGGNPAAIMLWQIIWYQLAGVFLWFALSKINRYLGVITAILFLFMPTGFYVNRYFWNANAMPIFSAFFFGTLLLALRQPSRKKLFLTGLVAGLGLQIEAAFGILFFPFAFLCFLNKFYNDRVIANPPLWRGMWRSQYVGLLRLKLAMTSLSHFVIGFAATLIPQIIFELRHGFIMTKVLFSEFTGKAAILGAKIPFDQRIEARYQELVRRITQLSNFHPRWIMMIFVFNIFIGIFILLRRKKNIAVFSSVSLGFLIFSAVFYLLFPLPLKNWYVLGISVPLVLIISTAASFLLSKNNLILTLAVILFLVSHVLFAIKYQTEYIEQSTRPSNDPSNLRNELMAIDWVYAQDAGKGFRAYNYIPSVYDFNYNYLYWWYGSHKYGYQPAETAYLPDQPEYIRDSPRLWAKAKPADSNSSVFLIIETDHEVPEREQKWLGHFAFLCLEKEIVYPFGLQIRKMKTCPTN